MSQVRSLTLDSLKPSVVRKLKAVGNAKSNAVYEAHLQEDFDRTLLKKGENRQDFITEKYVGMKYTSAADKERILIESEFIATYILVPCMLIDQSATPCPPLLKSLCTGDYVYIRT